MEEKSPVKNLERAKTKHSEQETYNHGYKWHRGIVVITTAQLHSNKPELKFCAGSKPARGVPEIRDGEDLWQWSRLEIRLNAFRRSTIPQKQFMEWRADELGEYV